MHFYGFLRKKARPITNDRDRINTANDLRQTYAYIIAGMIGATVVSSGAFFTYRGWHTSHEGQIAERFTRAIDQLASEKLEVRLGGIYALERIARDSAVDHGPVFEVLTAFVRERWPGKDHPDDHALHPAATDRQAVLTVVSRRGRWLGNGETQILDLSGSDLCNAVWNGARLIGANLSYCHLRNVNLAFADLDSANLTEANLRGANLAGANLSGANLYGADLALADLSGATVMEADLSQVDLERANLAETRFVGVDLQDTIGLTERQISRAILDDFTTLPRGFNESLRD